MDKVIKKIACAVIYRAVKDFDKKKLKQDSKSFFSSKSRDPKTYLWWCELAEINSEYVLREIKKGLQINN